MEIHCLLPNILPQLLIRVLVVLQDELLRLRRKPIFQPLADLAFSPGVDIHISRAIQMRAFFFGHAYHPLPMDGMAIRNALTAGQQNAAVPIGTADGDFSSQR
jgi:hypothetical protein